MRKILTAGIMWVLVIAIGSCASGPSQREARRDLEEGRVEEAVAKLETLAAANPGRADVQMDLGVAHFRIARKALDEGDQATYLAHIAQAQDAVLRAAEADPKSPEPHTWMGIIAAYQSDMERTLTSMKNAARLQPMSPIAHTNLAETYIYLGDLSMARRHLAKARELRAPAVYVEMNEVLAAWRTGDYVEARDIFDGAYALNPDIVKIWNEAPVAEPIDSFEDFTRFCCNHIACGPYMADACADMKHAVRERNVDAETARQELVLEMERRRRLEQIYREKGLQIEVEPPDAE